MATDLYPIRKDCINKQLYLLVKTVMTIRSVKAYRSYAMEFPDEEQLDIKMLSYQLKNDHAFLIFPSLHRQFRIYPQEITSTPAIIAIYKDKYLIQNNEDGRDIEYIIESFYSLEFKDGNDTQLVLLAHAIEDQGEGLPVFVDNTKELLSTLDRLLWLISDYHLEHNEWYIRLQKAREMLVNKEDGIRILHNMGFFDSENLIQTIIKGQANEHELNDVVSAYIDNLKIFAMLVVNGVYEMMYDYQKNSNKPHATPPPPPKPKPKPAPLSEPKLYTVHSTYDAPPISQYERRLHETRSFADLKEEKDENNSRILRNIVIYAGAVFLLVGALILAKYSITGSATISVGVISAIIMRNIARLKEGYVHDDPQPRWFVVSIAFACIILVFCGILVCKWLSVFVYHVTNGLLTPFWLFCMVLAVMIPLFIYARKVRRRKSGKDARLYICMMAFSVCMCIGQCTGSITGSRDIDYEKWQKSMEGWDKSNEDWNRQYKNSQNAENKKKIEGKWIYNAFLGMKTFDEEFMADGTWQRNDSSVMICKGQWDCVDGDKVKMSVTWVNQEADYKPSEFEWTMVIQILNEKDFSCLVGERFDKRTRKTYAIE